MSTVIKALPQQFATRTQIQSQTKKELWQVMLLIIIVFASAFAVVYVKDLHRRLFIDYQNLQDAQNQLYVNWGRLLLEQSTWSTQARVQTLAQQRLQMKTPAPKEILLVE
jgi:cell division protein FtsL